MGGIVKKNGTKIKHFTYARINLVRWLILVNKNKLFCCELCVALCTLIYFLYSCMVIFEGSNFGELKFFSAWLVDLIW